jgi:hypothetical protein
MGAMTSRQQTQSRSNSPAGFSVGRKALTSGFSILDRVGFGRFSGFSQASDQRFFRFRAVFARFSGWFSGLVFGFPYREENRQPPQPG